MIAALQRMYRHFYFRLCDVVDTAALADEGWVDYEELRILAKVPGIWEGVATYLKIVSDYARSYRGCGLAMPSFVAEDALFGGGDVYFGRGFLRVPILPQSVQLYRSQLAGVLGRGQLSSGARLSLLPRLATAAVVGQNLPEAIRESGKCSSKRGDTRKARNDALATAGVKANQEGGSRVAILGNVL